LNCPASQNDRIGDLVAQILEQQMNTPRANVKIYV